MSRADVSQDDNDERRRTHRPIYANPVGERRHFVGSRGGEMAWAARAEPALAEVPYLGWNPHYEGSGNWSTTGAG